MSTVFQSNKEKKRNTHLHVKEARRNIVLLLSYYRNAVFFPLHFSPRLNLTGGFGTQRVSLAFSPRVKVAESRRVQRGVAWVALWQAFFQTQKLVF